MVKKNLRVAQRYQLLRKLGEGGMGIVYLARDHFAKAGAQNQLVALKFLSKGTHPEHLRSFKQEFLLLTKLHHPHLAHVYDFGFDPGRNQYFFTSELLKGKDLFAATRDCSVQQIVSLMMQLCEVLSYIHQQGVLHNDIKPSNIWVVNNHIKVLDFGVSSLLDPLHQKLRGGTVGYQAPEVMRSGKATKSSDLYSLGRVFYKILMGELPSAISSTSLITSRTDLPAKLSHLIERMLQKFPQDRPTDGHEILKILSSVSKEASKEIASSAKDFSASPFVGRQIELDQILSLLQQERNTPYFLGLWGGKGIGKTRLLKEVLIELQVRGWTYAYANTRKDDPFYSPWPSLFQQLEAFHPEPEDLNRKQISRALFSRQVATQDLGESLGDVETAELPADEQMVLFYNFGRYLEKLCGEKPTAILLDDFDEATFDSQRLLQYLLRFPIRNCVFVVTGSTQLEKKQGVAMKALAIEDIEKMAAATLGSISLPRPWLKELLERSQGIPSLILDCLTEWRDRGWIKSIQGKWKFSKSPGKSLTYKTLHLARFKQGLKKESTQERALLLTCSTFLSTFSAETIQVLWQRPLKDLHSFLKDQVHNGVFLRSGSGTFQWKDESVRIWCYDKMLRQRNGARQAALRCERLGDYYAKNHEKTLSLGDLENACRYWSLAKRKDLASLGYFRLGHLYSSRCAFGQAEESYNRAFQGQDVRKGHGAKQIKTSLVDLYFRQGQGERGLTTLQELFETRNADDHERAQFALKMAIIHRSQGAFQKAIDLAKQALALVSEKTHPVLCARLYAQTALCQARLGNVELAFQTIEQSLRIVSKKNEPQWYALLLNIEGSLFLDYGKNPTEALKDFEEVRQIYETVADPRRLAIVHHNLGLAYGKSGQRSDELSAYAKALEFARRSADVRRILFCLRSMGNYHFRWGEIAKAQSFFQESLSLARLLEDHLLQATLLLNLGQVCHFQAAYEEGFPYFKAATELIQNFENPRAFRYDLLSWYSFLFSLGKWDEAQKALDQIVTWSQVKRKNKDPLFEAYVELFRGECLGLQRKFEASALCLKKALSQFEKDQAHALILEVKILLIQNDLLAGKTPAVEDREILQNAIATFKKEGSFFQVLRANLIWLKVCEVTPSTAEKVLGEALALLKKHQDLWLQVPEFFAELQVILARLYERQGRAEEAIHCLESSSKQLYEICSCLLPENQKAYRSTLLFQEMERAFESFINQSQAGFQEWKNRKKEYTEKLQCMETYLSLLKVTHGLRPLLKRFLEISLAMVSSPRGILFLEREGNLEEVDSLILEKAKPWEISSKLREQTEQFFLRLSRKQKMEGTEFADVCMVPLYVQEKLLGLYVFEKAKNSQLAPLFFRELIEYAALLIDHAEKMRALNQAIDKSTTSLSRSYMTNWQEETKTSQVLKIGSIVGGRSLKMVRALDLLTKAVPSDVTLLLEGETGTGKELLAQTIHALGPKSQKPFVVVQASSMSKDLWESRLFGHVAGAFTGASSDQAGLLQEAHEGTLFLDDVSEIPLEVQTKILNVLETNEFRPLGAQETRVIQFRMIAATKRDLREMVSEGSFREDLFFRLNVIRIHLPPLRERREDIPYLVEHFLEKACLEFQKSRIELSEPALRLLYYASWPGNVRQLETVIKTLVQIHDGKRCEIDDLPPEIKRIEEEFPDWRFSQIKKQFMKEYITQLLQYTQGNISQAAQLSGIPRPHLHVQIKRYLR